MCLFFVFEICREAWRHLCDESLIPYPSMTNVSRSGADAKRSKILMELTNVLSLGSCHPDSVSTNLHEVSSIMSSVSLKGLSIEAIRTS